MINTIETRVMGETELKELLREIPPTDDAHAWSGYRREIRRHMEAESPEQFLRWSTIQKTLFVGNAEYIRGELEELKDSGEWIRWRLALEENDIGSPPRLPYFEESSGNMVHQAYHLLQWEQEAYRRVEQLKVIVEFGGGYGAMARLIRRLGFEGQYIIYDLPELSLLQQYYLTNNGIEVELRQTAGNSFPSPPRSDLLIACFSLSECPDLLRRRWLAQKSYRYYLIGFQEQWDRTNLWLMFSEFTESNPDLRWVFKDGSMPGHKYLLGVDRA